MSKNYKSDYLSLLGDSDTSKIYAPETKILNEHDDAVLRFNTRNEAEPEYLKKIRQYITLPGVTDIHLTEGKNITIRRFGKIMHTDIIVDQAGINEITDKIFKMPTYSRDNAAAEFDHGRVRMRYSKSKQREQLFLRILPERAPTLDSLGYAKYIRPWLVQNPEDPGIVILAGATGSGKSTLIASVVQEIIDKYPLHVVTAEDPIEYIFYEGKGEVSQREIPDDISSYDEAIVNAMREDPDVILIGETRDAATAVATLQAAETGHLVFTTLHAPNIPGVIGRLLGMLTATVDSSLRLADVLKGCIYIQKTFDKNGMEYRKLDMLNFTPEMKELVRNKKDYYKLSDYQMTVYIPAMTSKKTG